MTKLAALSLLSGMLALASCASNSVEELPKDPAGCDTTNMTYTANIASIFSDRGCLACHSTQIAQNGIILDTYEEVSLNSDLIIPAISWPAGTPSSKKMPPGGPQLPQCDIDQFIAWVNQGKQK